MPADHRLQFLVLLLSSRFESQTSGPHETCPSQTHKFIHPLSSPQLGHTSSGLQKRNSGVRPSDAKVHNCTLQTGTNTHTPCQLYRKQTFINIHMCNTRHSYKKTHAGKTTHRTPDTTLKVSVA